MIGPGGPTTGYSASVVWIASHVATARTWQKPVCLRARRLTGNEGVQWRVGSWVRQEAWRSRYFVFVLRRCEGLHG